MKKLFLCIVAVLVISAAGFRFSDASANDVQSINVNIRDDQVFVSTSIMLDEKVIEEIQKGISREFIFYLDLYREWKLWPDEFIAGKKTVRTIRKDPVIREYVVTTVTGSSSSERKFRNLGDAVTWAMTLTDEKIAYLQGLDAGTYLVRIAMDARQRTLPPLIGSILFFLPEHEFSISKKSAPFPVPPKNIP